MTPESKATDSSGEAPTTRLSSHSAIDGAAESTSPTPAIRTIRSSGRPMAAVTAWMMPTGTVAMYVAKRWWAKRFRWRPISST